MGPADLILFLVSALCLYLVVGILFFAGSRPRNEDVLREVLSWPLSSLRQKKKERIRNRICER